VTDGDVRRFFSNNYTSEGKTAADIMSHNPKCIRSNETLKNALNTMELHKITNLFVTDHRDCPVGIIHIHDIVEI
jgi:arabinose-5-phosphate isomerase